MKTLNYKIINHSNNCYLNVIIQMLLKSKYTCDIILNSNLLNIKNDIIEPSNLLTLIKNNIDINRQNDAQEALTFILDKLPKLNTLFEGSTKKKFKCGNCNKIRIKEDTFITLNIYEQSMEKSIKNMLKDEEYNLECEKCKCTSKTQVKNNISNIGKLLVFYNIQKIKLDISLYIQYNNNKYKLIGYIKHFGNQNGGHYIYYDTLNNLEIDDMSIRTVSSHNLDNIYLIIYEKN